MNTVIIILIFLIVFSFILLVAEEIYDDYENKKKGRFVIIAISVFFIILKIICSFIDPYYLLYGMTNDPLNSSDYKNNYSYKYKYNTTHLSGRPGWEAYFTEKPKGYIALENADKKYILNNVFKSSIPQIQNRAITKDDLYEVFKNNLNDYSLKGWHKIDQTKYIRKNVLEPIRFEFLFKTLSAISSSNPGLDLKWWDLCNIYGLSHHKDIIYDLTMVKNYTPESFYAHLEQNKSSLNNYWKRTLEKFKDRPELLYSYVRISAFVITHTQENHTVLHRINYNNNVN